MRLQVNVPPSVWLSPQNRVTSSFSDRLSQHHNVVAEDQHRKGKKNIRSNICLPQTPRQKIGLCQCNGACIVCLLCSHLSPVDEGKANRRLSGVTRDLGIRGAGHTWASLYTCLCSRSIFPHQMLVDFFLKETVDPYRRVCQLHNKRCRQSYCQLTEGRKPRLVLRSSRDVVVAYLRLHLRSEYSFEWDTFSLWVKWLVIAFNLFRLELACDCRCFECNFGIIGV